MKKKNRAALETESKIYLQKTKNHSNIYLLHKTTTFAIIITTENDDEQQKRRRQDSSPLTYLPTNQTIRNNPRSTITSATNQLHIHTHNNMESSHPNGTTSE
jgi:hypothetical protein